MPRQPETLPPSVFPHLARHCQTHHLDVRPLCGYAIDATPANAISLGYTHLTPVAIKAAVGELARVVTTLARGTRRGR